MIDKSSHDAMQSRTYDIAIKPVDDAISRPDVVAPDYLRCLRTVARSHAKQYNEAIATFELLEKDFAESDWLSRSRFDRANVYVLPPPIRRKRGNRITK